MTRCTKWPWLALLILLAGCSNDEPAEPPVDTRTDPATETAVGDGAGNLVLQGSLLYRSHGALQSETVAVIELLEAGADPADGERQLAEQRIGLVGRGAPVGFLLEVPPDSLSERARYRVRAFIEDTGEVAWQADPIALDKLEEKTDLGELVLLPVRTAGFSSVLHCGQLQISAGYEQDDLILQAAGERHRLLPVNGESSGRFEAEGDSSTRFTSRGDTALLTLRGQPYPECVAPGVLPKPFLAQGNEPAWQLRIEQDRLSLSHNGELIAEAVDYQLGAEDSESQTYQVEQQPGLAIRVQRRVCQDSMTDIPYPFRVDITLEDGELAGCGGDPGRLLQGVDWVFEHIGEKAPLDGSNVSLMFYPNNRFAGRASCNNVVGEYELTGESLRLTRAATTRKACEPGLMEQEQRFLELLTRVHSFAVHEDGGLSLLTPQAESLKARRD